MVFNTDSNINLGVNWFDVGPSITSERVSERKFREPLFVVMLCPVAAGPNFCDTEKYICSKFGQTRDPGDHCPRVACASLITPNKMENLRRLQTPKLTLSNINWMLRHLLTELRQYACVDLELLKGLEYSDNVSMGEVFQQISHVSNQANKGEVEAGISVLWYNVEKILVIKHLRGQIC